MGVPSKKSRKAPESDSDFEDDDDDDLDSNDLNMEEDADEFEDEEEEDSDNKEDSCSGEEEEKDNGNKDAEMEELEKEYMNIRHQEQDILKNLKHHKGEDVLKGQALRNQKVIWDKTLEFRFLLQKPYSNSNRLPQEPVRSQFCGSHKDVNAAYSNLVTSSEKTLNSLLELQEALVEKNPAITQDATNGNSGRSKPAEPSKNIGVDNDVDWSRISDLLSRMATFRNKEIDKWQTRARVNTGAASIKGRLQAFNQSISQQVAAYMRDPSRMVRQMQMRQSAVGVFGTVLKGEDAPKAEEVQSDAAAQADGDPELLDDSEFYQQLLKEFFETIDPTSSETAFYSLKKMQSKKRKIVDRRASKSRKIRLKMHGGRKRQTEQEKAASMQSTFDQLGWGHVSEKIVMTPIAPPRLGSVIPYAPDVQVTDTETTNSVSDAGAASYGPQTFASPPCHNVRRRGGTSTDASASGPKRNRGIVNGRKVEKLCETTGSLISVQFDNFTKDVSGKEFSSLIASQIGKIIQGNVRMTAPTWDSLEDFEKFKVLRELSVHFDIDQRTEMLEAIHTTASDAYKRWKHTLHKHYEQHGASSVPKEFNEGKDEWDWLVNHFGFDEYQRRSKANKTNREKKTCHHGSGSCKTINIAKVHKDAGSKHPHLDASVFAYYKPGQEEDIASQRAVSLKQMASKVVTQVQSQNPNILFEESSHLSLETQISITDTVFGRRAGKEVCGLGRAVHQELSHDLSATRRSIGAEAEEHVRTLQEVARKANERAQKAEEKIQAAHDRVQSVQSKLDELELQMSSMIRFLSSMGMPPPA